MENQLQAEQQELKFIQEITGKIQTTGQDIAINLKSRNLIVIGKNGSGKTSFLKSLYEVLTNNILEGHILKLDDYQKTLRQHETLLTTNPSYKGSVD
ncbi:hypothetical protein YA0729_27705, partial [Pseudomonas simiae]|uniref:hypothetical protein n=1 Tax=Pseudomonas simiae TaxID=321846 RepID=UPI001A30F759